MGSEQVSRRDATCERYARAISYAEKHVCRTALFCFNPNADCSFSIPDGFAFRHRIPIELAGFFSSLSHGRGAEYRVSARAAQWLAAAFPWGPPRLGGQAGIMANASAALGVHTVAYAASRSPELVKLFDSRVKVVGPGTQHAPRHYVVEFRKGTRMTISGKKMTIPETNRVIASHDPANFSLPISPEFKKASIAAAREMDVAVISGVHNLDSEGADQKLAEIASLVRAWRERNSRVRIHLELGAFHSRAVLRETIARLAGLVNSIGMNELEAAELTKIVPNLSSLVREVVVHQAAGSRIYGNSKRWHVEDAALFGHALAAFKAVYGRDGTLPEVKKFVSRKSLAFASFPDGIPAIKVEPEFTVGLGDTFTAGYALVK